MLFKEIWRRKGTSLLALVTITLAAGLFVGLIALNRTLQQQTVQQMKALGFNVVILPETATAENYWTSEYGNQDMPESYVETLAKAEKVTVDHLSGRLEKRATWQEQTAILTGILATRVREQKAPLGFKTPPEPGEVFCGFDLSRLVKVEKQADGKPVLDSKGAPKLVPIEVMGKTFRVGKRLARKEVKDDMRMYMNLADAQMLLQRPGRINLIEALGCRCTGDVITTIQKELETLLNRGAQPADRVKVLIPDEPKYYTREKMRKRIEGYAAMVAPAVMLVCLVWVGSLSYMNVRQRRAEIGLLRAVGVSSGSIAFLFMAKAALLGLAGAAFGFAAGSVAARLTGTATFELPAAAFTPDMTLLAWTLLITPAMTMLAGAVAAWAAVTMDPAEALREE